MRSYDDVAVARRLFAAGLNNCEISRTIGVPVSTVRAWRIGRTRQGPSVEGCSGCNGRAHVFASLPSEAYAYLLGQYLGDGSIASLPRTRVLRITCCDAYPSIKDEVADAIRAVLPGTTVGNVPRIGCTNLQSYSRGWPCLLPQHGPGRKHERLIRLTDWQIEHCERAPQMLLRGLVHADGCRSTNRVTAKGTGKSYEYPRYSFVNKSDDILLIFGAACDRVGVRYRWSRDDSLSVARREDVATLDTFIGPKS